MPVRFLHGPRLPLGQQLGEACFLACAGAALFVMHRVFERPARVVVDYAQRHGERAERQFHQHMREAAVFGVVHHHPSRLPVAIDNIDHHQRQSLNIELQALDPAGFLAAEQHRLAVFQPQLALVRAFGLGKIVKHVLVIDNAVLEDFDERRALVCVRGFEHIRQVLRHIEPARHKPRAHTQREGARRSGTVHRTQRGRRRLGAGAAGGGGLPLGQAVNLVVEQHDLHVHVPAKNVHQVVAADGQPVAVTRH